MFKDLAGAIERKKKNLIKGGEGGDNLNRAFTRFLDECFPEGKNLNFEVSALNNRIIIQASNKTVANELMLKISDLARIFREEKINPGQIIIR